MAAVVLLFAAGCFGSGDEREAEPQERTESRAATTTRPTAFEEELPRREGWASHEELTWLEGFGRWTQSLSRSRDEALEQGAAISAGAEAGDPEDVQALERLMTPLRSCFQDFVDLVGAPPTQRLRDVAGLVEAGCGHYARGVGLLLEQLHEGEAGSAIDPEAQGELERAVTAFGLVNDKVPPGGAQRLPILDGSAGRNRINPRYGRAAALLVEKTVEVRCWEKRAWRRLLHEARLATGMSFRPGETAGYTGIASSRVQLSPLVCGALDRLTYDRARPRDPEGRLLMSVAVGSLAHEAFHAGGVINEAAAECYGMQRLSKTALELGVPAGYADGLARVAWETYDLLTRAYRSPECRNGGRLDLDPNSSTWP